MLCFWMGNHKEKKPEALFPLKLDEDRYRKLVESGQLKFSKIRKQTPEEQEIMKQISGRKG